MNKSDRSSNDVSGRASSEKTLLPATVLCFLAFFVLGICFTFEGTVYQSVAADQEMANVVSDAHGYRRVGGGWMKVSSHFPIRLTKTGVSLATSPLTWGALMIVYITTIFWLDAISRRGKLLPSSD